MNERPMLFSAPMVRAIAEDGITFDSMEELYFFWWLKELKDAGVILSIRRADSYDLAEPVYIASTDGKGRAKQKCILKGASYTPDFHVTWIKGSKGASIVAHINTVCRQPYPIYSNELAWSVFEVKPILFGRNGLGNNAKAISQVYRKWLYQRKGVFTNLVNIGNHEKGWFAETFTPKRFLLTDKKTQARKINYPVRTMQQWLEGLP